MNNTNIIFFNELIQGWVVDDSVINELSTYDLKRELLIDALFEIVSFKGSCLYDLEC
jgi:hypothetical protein